MRIATAAPMPAMRYANVNAFAGCNIGVPCSPLEAVTSLNPKDYVWGAPSPQQQQLLFQQFLQMHFLHHLQVSQHNSAMAGAPMSMLLHPSQIPASHLTAHQHCTIIPGLSAMPGFLTAGQHLAAHQLTAAQLQPAHAPSQPAPSQVSSKARGAAKPVVKKEEAATSSKTSITPAPKPVPVPSKSTASEHPSSTTLNSGVNSADSVLSYLDKDDIFDCVGDLQMDMFDVMLSEHDYELQSGVKDQASAFCGAACVPSPSGSDNSIATVAGDAVVTTPTSNETLSFLQADVGLLPLPEEGAIAALDYAADFKDVADFEFTDLDQMVGLTDADLSCDAVTTTFGSSLLAPSGQSAKQSSRSVKVKRGSGVQKPTNRRCNAKNTATKNTKCSFEAIS